MMRRKSFFPIATRAATKDSEPVDAAIQLRDLSRLVDRVTWSASA